MTTLHVNGQRRDFEAFTGALKAQELAPLVYKVASFVDPALYLAWCDGDSHFREVLLPNAL